MCSLIECNADRRRGDGDGTCNNSSCLMQGPLLGAMFGVIAGLGVPFLVAGGVEAVNLIYAFFMMPETVAKEE